LEELSLSGDAWVKRQAFLSVAKHPNLLVFRMGHFEHADFKCSEQISEHPPKAFFVAGIFENKKYFPKLRLLYLEADCNLTAIMHQLIVKARSPELKVVLDTRSQ
jgi:hypothetical protein